MAKTKEAPIKLTEVELAEKISEMSSWIESAEEEMARHSKKPLILKVEAGYNHYSVLDPSDFTEFGSNQTERVSKYYKKLCREQILVAKKNRAALIKQFKSC